MPIKRLLVKGKIKPEEFERLDRAFTFTLKSLCLVDRDDPICEIVARKVIQVHANGMRDPKEIAAAVARELGVARR